MEIVTLREFARRIGVSLTAVQKGVKTGRIVAITDETTGKITGIDHESQAPAWTANSKHPQKKPNHIAGGRPRNDGAPPAAPAATKTKPKPPADQPTGGMSMSEVQRAREIVKLQIDNFKLREAQGELVSAADVRKQGHALASGIISGLYNIPDRCADEIAGMSDPHAIHKLLLTEIDNAVEALRKAYA